MAFNSLGRLVASAIVASSFLVGSAQAAVVPGVFVFGTAAPLGNPPSTNGYSFSTSRTFTLAGLGVFDANFDGLVDSHQVGLWDSLGTLISSTTVASGTGATFTDGFRWNATGPITLAAGSYRVGALFLTGNDPMFFGVPGSTLALISNPGLTYNGGAFANSSTLANPSLSAGTNGAYIGGGVMLQVPDVPEPGTWTMMMFGFGLVGYSLRCRSGTTAGVRCSN
jgi:hypothetical protein